MKKKPSTSCLFNFIFLSIAVILITACGASSGDDERAAPLTSSLIDEDGDGVFSDSDCNDGDDSIAPGIPEVLNDGIDQDCSGQDRFVNSVLISPSRDGNDERRIFNTYATQRPLLPSQVTERVYGYWNYDQINCDSNIPLGSIIFMGPVQRSIGLPDYQSYDTNGDSIFDWGTISTYDAENRILSVSTDFSITGEDRVIEEYERTDNQTIMRVRGDDDVIIGVSETTFDSEGRIIEKKYYNPAETQLYIAQMTYNDVGDVVMRHEERTDEASPLWNYSITYIYVYDLHHNKTETFYHEEIADYSDDEHRTYSYVYDSEGKVITCNTEGWQKNFVYNTEGELISDSASISDGTIVRRHDYSYDSDGRLIRLALMHGYDGSSRTHSYTYDEYGYITQEVKNHSDSDGEWDQIVTYEYGFSE